MTWSIIKQKNINPNFEMIDNVLKRLNGMFDSRDVYHHSAFRSEMFEFTYQKDDCKREAWEITFMGKTVACGGGFGLDYDSFYDEDYVFLTKENEEFIYKMAYDGAIETISNNLFFISYSDVPKEEKNKWIDIIKNGIDLEK